MPNDKIEQGNPDAVATTGNIAPAPASNEPPKSTGPSAEDKAALVAAEKLVADAAANLEADKKKAEDAAKDLHKKPDMSPDKEEMKVAAEKLEAEQAAAREAAKNTPLDIDKWGSTGHEGGDAVLGLLQNAGLEPSDAKELLFDAMVAGDLSKVDKAKLIEKVGADKAKLVMIGADAFLKDKVSKNAGIVKDIQGVAGSEANWKKVAEWAKADSGISDDTMSEYITMIDSGGAQARFAAGELVAAYNASDKNTTLDTPGTVVIEGDNSNTPGGRSLTRNDYAAEVAKLHKRGRVPTQSELDELSAARRRGRASS